MKLRIKGNSIRYRLSKSDVDRFINTGIVTEETDFGNNTLRYELRTTEAESMSATFENNSIVIFLPENLANIWSDPEKVGFNDTYEKLSLLIEKDFQCIDNTLEDQSDNYPNPLLKC
jgi:hypothetical protein